MNIARGEAGAIGLDEEAADTQIVRRDARLFDLRPDDGDICDAADRKSVV